MKYNSITLVLYFVLLFLSSESLSPNQTKDSKSNEKYVNSNHHIRHKKPLLNANFENRSISLSQPTLRLQLSKPESIYHNRAPRYHHKRRKQFLVNYPIDNSSYPRTSKNYEELMDVKLDLTISKNEEKQLARNRIVNDKNRTLCRRRRYTYGYNYYGNAQPYVQCPGWSRYSPHICISDCTTCQNPCGRYQQPAAYTPAPIYTGYGRNWYGPKHGCNCNPKGSELLTCDIKTGNCRCKLNYVGRTCDKCESGFWESPAGCIKCDCNPEGSRTTACDESAGRCYCKEGVAGEKCDACTSNYYGFSKDGCKQCEDCRKPGHICDQKTGRCVCPFNSHGVHCEKCLPNTWGHEPNIGCKECNCSKYGRKKQECNVKTGACVCDVAYSGQNCDKCAFGYYGYPKCRPCNCNKAGTDRSLTNCSGDVCQCNENGQCSCKKSVIGQHCDTCKNETFGLDTTNPQGCTECFCFGRSKKCTNAPYTWDQIPSNQILSENLFRIRNSYYWKLPQVFKGDRILSYNGYLRFKTETRSNRVQQLKRKTDPLVILKGNGLEVHYYLVLPQIAQKFEIQLQEDLWRTPTNTRVSRMEFMIVLQDVTEIFVKAADTHSSDSSVLVSVTLDTATEVKGSLYRPAIGIEKCECPSQYTSTSCQKPNTGYCRQRVPYTALISGRINIDSIVGRSTPCKCHGRSKTCDSETCRCQNCTFYTDGINCEKCTEGFYGSPMTLGGNCLPCPCPSVDRNFATSCDISRDTCICKLGYAGPKCEKCVDGFYGNPMEKSGSCEPCDCNSEGIMKSGCDESGQCNCKIGITGKKCSLCEKSRHILRDNICIPCDDCTQKLLDHVQNLKDMLHGNTSHLLTGKLQPPWEKLKGFETKYGNHAERFKNYTLANDKVNNLLSKANLDEMYQDILNIKDDFNDKKNKIDATVQDAINNYNQSLSKVADLKVIKRNLIEYTDDLNNFGKGHVSTRDAVKEAKAILNHMHHQYQKVQKIYPTKILNKCTAINDLLETLNRNSPVNQLSILNTKLNNVTDFLDSIDGLVKNTSDKIKRVEGLNLNNENRFIKLNNTLNQAINDTKKIKNEIRAANDLIGKTNKLMNETEALMARIEDEDFGGLVDILDVRQDELKTAIDFLERKFNAAEDHAKKVELKVEEIEKVFEKTDKQVNAEKASEAYANIVTLLKDANVTATDANQVLKEIKNELEPEGMDSLFDKTYILSANTSQLESRIRNTLKNRGPEVKDSLMKIENRLNGIKNKNWDNGIKDRELNIQIEQLTNEYSKMPDVKRIITDAVKESDKMKEIYKEAVNIKNFQIPYDLNKKFDKLKNISSPTEIDEIKRKINEARLKIQDMFKYFPVVNIDEKTRESIVETSNLSLKFQELKAKVRKSKEIADGIRVSLSGKLCTRSYRLDSLEPSLITTLKVRFSSNASHIEKPTSIFYLSNAEGQFMNLIITENKSIVFIFKPTSTEREYRLEMDLVDEQNTINLERIFNMVKMDVNGIVQAMNIKNGNIRFNINPSNLIHVGDAPEMKGLPGCIHDITFNGRKLGLWKFEKSGQCEGCSISTITDSVQTYRFNGDGYSMIKEASHSSLNPMKFIVQLWLNTFDENALLFLAPHHQSGTFLAITLLHGHIQYEVHYGKNKTPLIVKTEKKYNDGMKHSVEVFKFYKTGNETSQLKVDEEQLIASRIVKKDEFLKAKKTNFYIGGVPPEYFLYANNSTDALHTHQSFLGNIENCRSYQLFMLHETSKNQHQYGVQLTNKPLEFRKAWFEGDGHLRLKPQAFKSIFSFLYIIRTTDKNSFIMDLKGLATFFMKDGYVNVKIDDKVLSSDSKVNDDDYHVIELIRRTPQNYVLKIDGQKNDKQEIIKQLTSNAQDSESTSIIIGGVPETTQENEYFNGEISDIVIDNKGESTKIVKFNIDTISDFEKVKIGRGKSKDITFYENEMIKDNLRSRILSDENVKDQQPDGCDRTTNNSLELNAAKFGDMPESYVKYFLKEQFWKDDFSIQFSFRTFYKNGLLLFAQSDTKHYNLLELKEGSILLHIVGKRKKMLQFSKKLDDGEWHRILIENKSKKRKRKLTITLDGTKEKPKKIPQNRVSGDVFIGGVPQTIHHKLPKQLSSKLIPFKGCMKELKINRAPQSFLHHHEIGLCFSNIEKGSYFRGDAYVVYDRNFKVTNFLELKFEFRTREQNGILLSVSTQSNSPALSLELQNGAVAMSVDMGNGVVSNVTNFHSTYALCDNRWHNVTAVFSNELTVNVDGVSKSWVISEMGLMDEIEDPLYIGGLPDLAPVGTLKIRENFKGCIRNVKIGENYIDWIDMEELTNVSLNSCPVA